MDLPLSHDCRRVLAYAAEEAERPTHKHIGTAHLLLGLLRKENSAAAQLLRESLTLDFVRGEGEQSETSPAQREFPFTAGVGRLLAEIEARGGIWIVRQKYIANSKSDFAIYAGDLPPETQKRNDTSPAETLAQTQKRLESTIAALEHAISTHEFEKARACSEEERKERENLHLLRKLFNLLEPPLQIPFLRVDIVRDERFTDVQKRCDNYLAEGVAQVWLLDPNSRRAYTATRTEGLREFKEETLRIVNPLIELELKKIFL